MNRCPLGKFPVVHVAGVRGGWFRARRERLRVRKHEFAENMKIYCKGCWKERECLYDFLGITPPPPQEMSWITIELSPNLNKKVVDSMFEDVKRGYISMSGLDELTERRLARKRAEKAWKAYKIAEAKEREE